MKAIPSKEPGAYFFRRSVLLALMLAVTGATAGVLYFAEKRAADDFERTTHVAFKERIDSLRRAQEIRRAAILERCRTLVKKARIHAALEDNALDLLYPSAREELRDIIETPENAATPGLKAKFYRFLGTNGKLIPPSDAGAIGSLSDDEESRLSLPELPSQSQLGYIPQSVRNGADRLYEIVAMPVISTETGTPIAALVLGFDPVDPAKIEKFENGVYTLDRYYPLGQTVANTTLIEATVKAAFARENGSNEGLRVDVFGEPCLLFRQTLNPHSLYPVAVEISVLPLTRLHEQLTMLRWRIIGAGLLVIAVGYFLSRFFALRLARPVESIVQDSVQNRALRLQAELALEATNRELQRSVRFSADASHQLKTPVAVLRADLEELLAKPHLTQDQCNELDALVHQTYRLTNVIEDLLLLSRMEAGRLQINFSPVDLSLLLSRWIDDLGALPDSMQLRVSTTVPPGLYISGEERYVNLILQNLLENACKYNRPNGRVQVRAETVDATVHLIIGNTGQTIAPEAREHIFERFHRGSVGENIPGHGLGLNLARELARLHKGELKLLHSEDDWTEFAVSFVRVK
ncbi:MAG: HAMP domain-containing sensor histidine kinase [Nibricoccus sp.]